MQKRKGINSLVQKSTNRGLLFRELVTGSATSRAALTHASGLTKMTVSNIVAEFAEKKYVTIASGGREKATRSSPILLALSPDAPKVIGILIQRSFVSAALCDCSLQVLDAQTVPLQQYDSETLLETLFSLTDKFVQGGNILGIGIGSIGPLDIRKGVILSPPNFHGIENLPICSAFEQRYHLPVSLDHNYNSAALAEKHFGSCRSYQNLLYLGLTEGIGLGHVSGDQLYSRLSGYPSEIGHVSINFDGPQCLCGNNGCLEAYASTRVIEKRVLIETGDSLPFEEICRESDKPPIDRILMDMVYYLQVGLTGCVNLLNPQVIVIGDEGAYLPDRYLGYLEQVLNQSILSRNYRHVKIIKPEFHDRRSAAPCAMSILAQVFEGKLLFTR